MWSKIEETVDRAVSGIVYDIWGAVGFGTKYDKDTKEVCLVVYDRSYRCKDRKVILEQKFKFDLEHMSEFEAKLNVIEAIEKYLIENYT